MRIEEVEKRVKSLGRQLTDMVKAGTDAYMAELDLLKLAYAYEGDHESSVRKLAEEDGVANKLHVLDKVLDGHRQLRFKLEKVMLVADGSRFYHQQLAKFYVENRDVVDLAYNMENEKKPKWKTLWSKF